MSAPILRAYQLGDLAAIRAAYAASAEEAAAAAARALPDVLANQAETPL
jgi:hypothetical protein